MGPTDVGVQTAQLLEYTATLLTLVGGPVLTVPTQGVHSLSTRVRYRYSILNRSRSLRFFFLINTMHKSIIFNSFISNVRVSVSLFTLVNTHFMQV